MIRRPASFVTSMTDERGDELMYSGVKISEVVESGKGIGGVIALLWFQVKLYVDLEILDSETTSLLVQ